MNRIRRLFSGAFPPALFVILGMISPSLLFAQTAPAEWGLDYEGKAIVAVLPLAGEEEEAEMIRQFHAGTLEAVAALEKYNPLDIHISALTNAGLEIPTDMPPTRSLSTGARYALTGGVYPGNRAGEYYLQLWLWDMAGSTMIYTDDLVYDDMDGALQSLPGLVEWLFSHIREVTVETPAVDSRPDPFFMLGLRLGLSPRWYVGSGEVSSGASALNLAGGVSGAVRLSSLFSLQLELLLTGDTLVYRGLDIQDTIYNKKYSSLSLEIPALVKANFRVGQIRLSPLAGLYLAVPLGETSYHNNVKEEDDSYSWSFSLPLGITAGLEGALQWGPGKLFAGMRYAGDLGDVIIDSDPEIKYRRHTFSLYLGYEFGFFDRN
jgi:hypothetical protein